jgi:hypothetical protein
MSNEENKTHYRKAFNSPYLSSADIVGPTVLTISHVNLSGDQTKKTKDLFNTAHFVEKQLRQGEPLKPMILNAHNSKILKDLTNSHFIEDWVNIPITIYVDSNVRFGRDTVEGLRISPQPPALAKPVVTPENEKLWNNAKNAFKRDGNLNAVLEKADVSIAHQRQIAQECQDV